VIVARTRRELARARRDLGSGTLGLVPTMGALHDGHLSLVDLARADANAVAVSIFVNPLQFGPSEDFTRYPREEQRDLALLEARGADLAFVPTVEEMYPAQPVITVTPGRMGDRLCGAFRPGHFEGVLTVVAKLFGLFRPDVAVFGQKDLQQLVLIRRMVQDLDLGPMTVRGAPTLREADGLAMSSRNAYLSPEERRQAVGLSRSLQRGQEVFARGEKSSAAVLGAMRDALAEFPLLQPQYVEIVNADTLDGVASVERGSVMALAAFCGRTRLIDNAVLA
jgi:pantoate--beta-alanine ligase